MTKSGSTALKDRENQQPETRTGLSTDGVAHISSALRQLLADVLVLYLKTKNFHWHMSGRHFRDFHLLLDEHGAELFAMTDAIAERARKIGGASLRSISDISCHQRLQDNNEELVSAEKMLGELAIENRRLTEYHETCTRFNDVATSSLIETWIDETERRTWFLWEILGSH